MVSRASQGGGEKELKMLASLGASKGNDVFPLACRFGEAVLSFP